MSAASVRLTASINERRVVSYLPSIEVKEQWEKTAKDRGVSLSEMIFFLVRDALAGDAAGARARIAALEAQLDGISTKAAGLEKRLEAEQAHTERLERDLREYRARAFLDGNPIRKLDPRLLRVLWEAKDATGRPRVVTETELRKSLRFALDDPSVNLALGQQLVFLEAMTMVTKTPQGWTWNES